VWSPARFDPTNAEHWVGCFDQERDTWVGILWLASSKGFVNESAFSFIVAAAEMGQVLSASDLNLGNGVWGDGDPEK
jgi:hypothetical protein